MPTPYSPLPVVKIQADTDLGYMIINQKDFDEKQHKLFEPAKPKKKAKTTQPEKSE